MSLNERLKKCIQGAYSQFLQSKGHNPRYGQKLMIAAIARTLGSLNLDDDGERQSDGHVCVVEAGTGTGKTVAYLLATLPIAQALGKKVVISTATIALQEQIVFKDLPDVRKHSGLTFDFGLVKGRGRYLCLSKLDRLLDDSPRDVTFLNDDEVNLTPQDIALYHKMVQDLAQNRWQGDRDSWPDELSGPTWNRVTTDHRQCTGRRCSHVRQCSFFRARESLADVDCIVANHDLVLADLALGGGAILPAPKDTIYIFDEAHHLPEKALNHFSVHTRILATSRWLGMTEGQWHSQFEAMAPATCFMTLAAPVEAVLNKARTLIDQVQPLLQPLISQMERRAQVVRYRFPQGQVTPALEDIARQLQRVFTELHSHLDKLRNELDDMLEEEHCPVPKVDLETIYPLIGTWCGRAEANKSLWHSFADTTADPKWPIARWVTLVGSDEIADFELVSSPILASHTLDQKLWQHCCAAIATSATLTALGNFERFVLRSGTPQNAVYEVVPSPFDFVKNGVLCVPNGAVEGNRAEEHTASVIQLIPELIQDQEATLVLFASRRQMLDVYEGLPSHWQSQILMQGNESKQLLLDNHRKRVDDGQASILFGLASFAEGVDLPGNYCRHVIIAKIPFAVPDDPVESAMAEWIEQQGGNAFMQITVPDAAIKMVQACGRLLRTETDEGRVTVLDQRLISKRYGSAILNSLPPFTKQLGFTSRSKNDPDA